jgi:hypothetical protein
MKLIDSNMVNEVQTIVDSIIGLDVCQATKLRQLGHLLRDFPAELVVCALAQKIFSQSHHAEALERAVRLQGGKS